jgi:predicted nucleic acid-binding protein
MPFAAVLDASVLYPLPLRDTLLRVAEIELYDPYWSARILAEVARNLILDGRASEEQARNLTDAMRGAFDSATVPEDAIAQFESAMTNDPEDRHVLAAAVASEAQAIITLNLKHFPIAACEPLAIEPLHPDNFLLDLYSLDGDRVFNVLERQAAVLTRPPMTTNDLLDRLAATVPDFAQALRPHTKGQTGPPQARP